MPAPNDEWTATLRAVAIGAAVLLVLPTAILMLGLAVSLVLRALLLTFYGPERASTTNPDACCPGRSETSAVPASVVSVRRGAAVGGSSLMSSAWRATGVIVPVPSGQRDRDVERTQRLGKRRR